MALLLALGIGTGVGLIVGALGAGGGILSVPVLVYVLGQSPHQAASGSLVIVLVTALAALPSRARHGQVRWRDGALFGLLSAAGAWGGSWLSAQVDGEALMVMFCALLVVVAALMARRALRERRDEGLQRKALGGPDAIGGTGTDAAGGSGTADGPGAVGGPDATDGPDAVDELGTVGGPGTGTVGGPDTDAADRPGTVDGPGGRTTPVPDAPASGSPGQGRGAGPDQGAGPSTPGGAGQGARRVLMVVLTATLTGLLTGFFGVGGGFAVVPVLLLVLHCDVREAAGTSLLVMIIAALVSLAQRASGGLEVAWGTVALFTLGSTAGGLAGGPLSQRLRASTLNALFAALLLAVAVGSLIGAT